MNMFVYLNKPMYIQRVAEHVLGENIGRKRICGRATQEQDETIHGLVH